MCIRDSVHSVQSTHLLRALDRHDCTGSGRAGVVVHEEDLFGRLRSVHLSAAEGHLAGQPDEIEPRGPVGDAGHVPAQPAVDLDETRSGRGELELGVRQARADAESPESVASEVEQTGA